ncbi:TetR/AcrR family transcriptional regulator [Aetokthonos hydrillicola]|jgi:AcrR family transcriptional regulator|uniref:TetR/AcrR family transcriptional regulator n=2 Tax=Aetokthonos hydrillicola TaxID=1550245 RepID=UPI001B1FA05C|nr:TetR/AcrR family transcriptional regulator [Aetokthonos hydrillicola CCALA 1050]MBW4584004.1 TetR family transcriptional regulator [Aetokthonos hydrillicola CCALA 1050]
MTKNSYLPINKNQGMRRQPQQKRSQQRVERMLDAAAEVFDEVGYEAATTHAIAARAKTAIGSLYQFFPDKLAIFHALELRHVERVRAIHAKLSQSEIIQLPFEEFIQTLAVEFRKLFEQPTSRIVFVQYFTSAAIFQTIDESFTQEAIDFTSQLWRKRNPELALEQSNLLAKVCVHTYNTLVLIALRSNETDCEQIFAQIEALLIAYLRPYVGDEVLNKVMKCPHCRSQRLSKNGHRHGKQRYLCKDCGKQFPENLPE